MTLGLNGVRRTIGKHVLAALVVTGLAGSMGIGSEPVKAEDKVVNVYSFRQEILIRPILDAFTAKTGIEVRLVSAKDDALLERLKSEGEFSPADVLLTADAGRLWRAKEAGVLQPVSSATLDQLVPAQYRDPEGYWYGLSTRARTIMVAADRVAAGEISTYADLADEKWRGRICIRSSGNIYNQSMLGAFIAHYGPAWTETWAAGLVANLARKPAGGDRDQIRAVAAGECDVAVSNTYYLGRLATSDKEADREVAQAVRVVWPDQSGRGVHVNVSGAAVTKSASHKADAVRLLEFLAGPEAQALYAGAVYEYPVLPGTPWSGVVAAWGEFRADDLNLSALGENNAEAVRIADRVGWR